MVTVLSYPVNQRFRGKQHYTPARQTHTGVLTQHNYLLNEHNVAVASVILVGLVRALHGACQETVTVLSLRLTWGILTLFPGVAQLATRF